jgi:hypothetical protein
MSRNLLKSIGAAGILFFGLSLSHATAQYRDQDSWHHDRDSYYRGQEWRMQLFNRVREDLNHVQATAFTGGDMERINRTKEELGDLQGKLASNRYDQPELDRVISSLTRIVADNRLAPRDREMLTDDLNRVREYREHHSDWH